MVIPLSRQPIDLCPMILTKSLLLWNETALLTLHVYAYSPASSKTSA